MSRASVGSGDAAARRAHSSEGEEDLIEQRGDAGDGDGGGLGTAFLGVHVHPPTASVPAQGCEDQEMLEEMLEKRIRLAERESERRRRRQRRRRTLLMRSGAPVR